MFDDFAWWDERDVLTQITPDRLAYIGKVAWPLAGRSLLDVGCGGGMLAEPLARAGARVTGIDVSASALQVASSHARQSASAIGYLQATAEQLPFPDASFDLVVAFDVLEHVADLASSIREISRVLRVGGKLIYDTMNRTFMSRLMVIWIGEHLWRGGPPRGTHHWHKLIKPRELAALLDREGIANVETKGFLPNPIADFGRLRMSIAPYKGVSYVGYGIKRCRSGRND
ncbi:MAG: bifunctional 2-polyprenyl-6-hydroxyphenol methylase/3-demethylubiquinol 3-O-methyltransferase UbiG [Chloroflexota bacterium]